MAARAVAVLASDADLGTAGAAELYAHAIDEARANSHFGDERVWWSVLHLEQRFPWLTNLPPDGTWARANNDAAHPADRLSDAQIEKVNEAVRSFVPLDGTYEQTRRGYARAIASLRASIGRTVTTTAIYLVLDDDLHRRLGPYPPDMDKRLLKWARRRERLERPMKDLQTRSRMRRALTPLIARMEPRLVTQDHERTDGNRERGGPQRRAVRVVRRRAHAPPGSSDPSGSSDDELARRALIGGAV